VAAAARAAYAAEMGINASQVPGLSENDIQFCSPSGPARSCLSSWNLYDALEELRQRQIATDECMPYNPAYRSSSQRQKLCTPLCKAKHPAFATGNFSFISLQTAWEVQQHIRHHGSVLTRFDIDKNFRPFFDNTKNSNAVYHPPSGAVNQSTSAQY
jgi:hypothetical protein